jgi:hypothetical protein
MPIMFSLPASVVIGNETFRQLPKLEARVHKWATKKVYDSKVDERLFRGMKPHEVKVIPRGRIDGDCEGKNAWDDILRSMAPRELDVSIVHVKDRNPTDMATFRT